MDKVTNVFVTGGNGFIGSHVVERLLSSGYTVRALVRETSNISNLEKIKESDNFEFVYGDITQPETLKGKMKDCKILIHIAALASDWGSRKVFEEINVQGTLNVLKEAKGSNIFHMIHVSSNAVMGEEDCNDPKPESSHYRPRLNYFLGGIFPSAMNHYRETKAEGERAARDFCRNNGIKLTVARPVWVYGERELNSGPYYSARSASKGTRIIPGRPNTRFHCIYVKDLSYYIVKLIEREGKEEMIVNIGSKYVPTIDEVYGHMIIVITGKDPKYVPKWVIYPIGLWMESIWFLFRAEKAPILTRARVNMGFFNNVYDTSLLHETFPGFREISLEEGIRNSVKWWKDHGYL